MKGGIDLGGTKIQAVVADEGHEVLGQARRATPTEGGPPAVAAEMAEAMRGPARQAGIETDSLAGVGVGSPGRDRRRGGHRGPRGQPARLGRALRARRALTEQLGTKVFLGNDVDVAVEPEFELGAGRDVDSLLGVFWGTGVGGGIILDGRPWLGRGAAGEIGHMVVKPGGRAARAGAAAAWRPTPGAAPWSMRARKLVKKGHKTEPLHHHGEARQGPAARALWELALKDGDRMADALIDEAIQAIGVAVASAVNLLDVEMVVIGGGLGHPPGRALRQADRGGDAAPPVRLDRPPAVKVAALGDLGGAIGASLLVEVTGGELRPLKPWAGGDRHEASITAAVGRGGPPARCPLASAVAGPGLEPPRDRSPRRHRPPVPVVARGLRGRTSGRSAGTAGGWLPWSSVRAWRRPQPLERDSAVGESASRDGRSRCRSRSRRCVVGAGSWFTAGAGRRRNPRPTTRGFRSRTSPARSSTWPCASPDGAWSE